VFALDDQSVEIARRGIFCLTPTDWAVPLHFQYLIDLRHRGVSSSRESNPDFAANAAEEFSSPYSAKHLLIRTPHLDINQKQLRRIASPVRTDGSLPDPACKAA
jgi:hypothetical protein